MSTYQLSQLDALEAEAIHICREVAAEFEHPVLMFSGGKDSLVMLRLAQKAFHPAGIPFAVLHVDTGHICRNRDVHVASSRANGDGAAVDTINASGQRAGQCRSKNLAAASTAYFRISSNESGLVRDGPRSATALHVPQDFTWTRMWGRRTASHRSTSTSFPGVALGWTA